MKRIAFVVAAILVTIAVGYAAHRIEVARKEDERAERQRERAAADRQAREKQEADAELGRTFGACQAACPKETVALQVQELGQKVWFKCFCVLPDRIMERNVAYPKPQAEKAPSE